MTCIDQSEAGIYLGYRRLPESSSLSCKEVSLLWYLSTATLSKEVDSSIDQSEASVEKIDQSEVSIEKIDQSEANIEKIDQS